MQFTLNTSCVRELLAPTDGGKPFIELDDLPKYARESLGLHGINLTTDLLKGSDRKRLETLRERADKAACACLALIEPEAQPFGHEDDERGIGAIERTGRVLRAAGVLGCNAIAITLDTRDDEETFENVVDQMKEVAELAERLDMNVLLTPGNGLTAEPERVTELIKRIGGFRIGTMPDFQVAVGSEDPALYLRRLTPYAAMVTATTVDFRLVDQEEMATATAGGGEQAESSEGSAEEDDDAAIEAALAGEDGDGFELPTGGLEKLMAMLEEPAEVYAHEPYALDPLVQAVISVGYDGIDRKSVV